MQIIIYTPSMIIPAILSDISADLTNRNNISTILYTVKT